MSRTTSILLIMALGLVNAAFAVTMFSTGLWIIGLLNTASALYSLYTLYRF